MNTKLRLVLASAALAVLPLAASADTLTRQLELGSRGSDVSSLQTFLATDRTLYPQGLITGYYGILTQSAVANFQARNGIDSVGRVGPATLPVINLQMTGGVSMNPSAAPTISNIGVTSSATTANVSWSTNEGARGVVYYSANPLMTTEHLNSVDSSGTTAQTDYNYNTYQNVLVSGLQANTTYYYMIYSTDQSGNVSVSWPSTFHTAN